MKTLIASLCCFVAVVCASGADETNAVALNWLGGASPRTSAPVSWGVPWPRGKIQPADTFILQNAEGKSVPLQTWPLAYWPDGSLKWSGHATLVPPETKGPFQLIRGTAPATAAVSIHTTDTAEAIEIDTGAVRARLPKSGVDLIESLTLGDRVVAQKGRLIALREDRSAYETEGVTREERFTSKVKTATLEQSGPVRAVVKIEGVHQAARTAGGGREWLPFTVRLYFSAGSAEIRLVHSFVFDGDGNQDFLKGIGLSFSVPFKEELHNRHLRFVGDGDGVWAQPVVMLPGYRAQTGRTVNQLYAKNLAGQRVPNLAELDPEARNAILPMPHWGDARIVQVGSNGFSIDKRTAAGNSWLHYTDGKRARGLAVMGDVSGGLAVGVKNFWQKYPSSIELTNGASEAGEIKIWLWSPEGGAMDLRHYDSGPHGLSVNYEDWKPGWSTPLGIANTADLTLWAFNAIPSNAELVEMAKVANEPPILVCSPEYYHAQHVFGRWSLVDRSTPELAWVEDQIGGWVDFYHQQVDERSWYGFWNYGDIMHNYDFVRHDWRYDVGGWAWVNTELMPDMLLWYTFLRTGRSDIYRMAEAMTRHTSEVDVHHVGPFAPLGSRHNVSHWGDGAKQPRISHVGLKQFYYFLTTDERIGDLMREQLTADRTFSFLQKYNPSHYVPTEDGKYALEKSDPSDPPRPAAPRPEEFPPLPEAPTGNARVGLEWMCYAMNWTMEWQRTGNTQWRDRVLNDMKRMSAGLKEDGRLPGRYFDMIFGGAENMYEMEPMYDVPEFWRAWANTSADVGRQVTGNEMTGPRMLAYAAYKTKDPELGRLAWEKLIGKSLPPVSRSIPAQGSGIVKPVTDPWFLGREVGWQLHGVASVQWALNAIETLEFAKEYLPEWKKKQP